MSRLALMISILLLVAGCASHENFRKGKSLLDEGKPAEGLQKIKLAMEEQPGNIEYRAYYYRQRESWINRLLREADTARVNRHWDTAIELYRRVLEIDEANVKAQDGLQGVDAGRRRANLLMEAENLLKKDQVEAAQDKLRLVLAEDPANNSARSLASKIAQKRATASTPAARLADKFRKPVSLEFKDAPAKAVFELLSKSAGVNFILDRDVRSDLRVSVFVRQTTIEAALQNILSTTQLGKKVLDESSVLIYPVNKKADYEEIVVRTFYLSSVDPKQAMELLKTVVKTKDIFVDEKLNILVIRDTAEAVRVAEKLIAAYDLGDPEVLLEVEVLEISSGKLQELGVKYPNQLTIGVEGTPGAGQLTFNDLKHFSSDFGVVSINNPAFVLNLRGTDATSNLLANPRIRVKNHKQAKVHIGDRVPVITTTSTSTGFASETVNYLDVGLKLDVEPSVMVADEVSIDIGLEVSTIVNEIVSKNGTLTYRIGTRNANTTLRLRNGETQMLAGLISDEERSSADRVPGFSDIPLIGRLFSSKKDTRDKTEIVLLLTPYIVRNIVPPESSYSEFSIGTESGNLSSTPTIMAFPVSMPSVMTSPTMSPSESTLLPAIPQTDAEPTPALPPPPPLPVNPQQMQQ